MVQEADGVHRIHGIRQVEEQIHGEQVVEVQVVEEQGQILGELLQVLLLVLLILGHSLVLTRGELLQEEVEGCHVNGKMCLV